MITITHINGMRYHLHPDAIARVAQAGPNWHRIGAYVRTFDGKTIEAVESADEIKKAVEAESHPPHKAQNSAIDNIMAFVASDALAVSYQSLAQYRSALLRLLNEAKANE